MDLLDKRRKKRAVRLDYGSDSDEEAPAPPADDMFADEPAPAEPVMDMEAFEKEIGQGEEADGSDGEVPLEAFHLRQEASEGTFDLEGNYTRHEAEEEPDEPWMASGGEAVERARLAQLQRERAAETARKRRRERLADTSALLAALIEVLEPAETALEALGRLAPPRQRGQRSRGSAAIDLVTDVCNELGDRAVDAYNLSREELMRIYHTETGSAYRKRRRDADDGDGYGDSNGNGDGDGNGDGNGDENGDSNGDGNGDSTDYGPRVWFFRWLDDPGETHGPWLSYEMAHWRETYFGDRVEVRREGEAWRGVGEANFGEQGEMGEAEAGVAGEAGTDEPDSLADASPPAAS